MFSPLSAIFKLKALGAFSDKFFLVALDLLDLRSQGHAIQGIYI